MTRPGRYGPTLRYDRPLDPVQLQDASSWGADLPAHSDLREHGEIGGQDRDDIEAVESGLTALSLRLASYERLYGIEVVQAVIEPYASPPVPDARTEQDVRPLTHRGFATSYVDSGLPLDPPRRSRPDWVRFR